MFARLSLFIVLLAGTLALTAPVGSKPKPGDLRTVQLRYVNPNYVDTTEDWKENNNRGKRKKRLQKLHPVVVLDTDEDEGTATVALVTHNPSDEAFESKHLESLHSKLKEPNGSHVSTTRRKVPIHKLDRPLGDGDLKITEADLKLLKAKMDEKEKREAEKQEREAAKKAEREGADKTQAGSSSRHVLAPAGSSSHQGKSRSPGPTSNKPPAGPSSPHPAPARSSSHQGTSGSPWSPGPTSNKPTAGSGSKERFPAQSSSHKSKSPVLPGAPGKAPEHKLSPQHGVPAQSSSSTGKSPADKAPQETTLQSPSPPSDQPRSSSPSGSSPAGPRPDAEEMKPKSSSQPNLYSLYGKKTTSAKPPAPPSRKAKDKSIAQQGGPGQSPSPGGKSPARPVSPQQLQAGSSSQLHVPPSSTKSNKQLRKEKRKSGK